MLLFTGLGTPTPTPIGPTATPTPTPTVTPTPTSTPVPPTATPTPTPTATPVSPTATPTPTPTPSPTPTATPVPGEPDIYATGPSSVMKGVVNADFILSASNYSVGFSAARVRIVGTQSWTPSWSLVGGATTVRGTYPWSAYAIPSQVYNTVGNYTFIIETISTTSSGMTATVNFEVTPVTPYGTGILYRTYQV